MSGIYHQNKEWANVTTPNPAGTASTDLTKLGIDGVNYNVKDADAYHDGDLATVAETGNYSDLSNTPTIPTKTSDLTNDSDFVESSDLATVATSGSYNDLTNKPTIPAAQVNSDWDASSGVAAILHKPALATVATSGSYNDLSNKPTIPTVNNGTLTIKQNNNNLGTFTANQSIASNINIECATPSDVEGAKTVTGNPLTITDAAPIKAEQIVFGIEPIQDKHGYDKPWVGGAGKNKLPMTVAGIKAANTTGTWSGNSYTIAGVRFDINTDTGENVISIGATRVSTHSSNAILHLGIISSGSYKINGTTNGSASTYYILDASGQIENYNGDSDLTVTSDRSIYIRVMSGYQANNVLFYPMARLSTETDSTFATYTNISPITGLSEVSVDRTGANLFGGLDFAQKLHDAANTSVIDTKNKTVTYNRYKTETTVLFDKLKPNTTYTLILTGNVNSANTTNNSIALRNNEGGLYGLTFNSTTKTRKKITFDNVKDLILTWANGAMSTVYYDECGLFEGEVTVEQFEEYLHQRITIQLGQTVYGGKLTLNADGSADINGVDGYYKFTGQETWSIASSGNCRCERFSDMVQDSNGVCSHLPTGGANGDAYFGDGVFIIVNGRDAYNLNSTNAVQAFTTNMEICYKLATPFTIHLTAEQLQLLENLNNISTNAKTLTVKYQPNNAIGEAKGLAMDAMDMANAVASSAVKVIAKKGQYDMAVRDWVDMPDCSLSLDKGTYVIIGWLSCDSDMLYRNSNYYRYGCAICDSSNNRLVCNTFLPSTTTEIVYGGTISTFYYEKITSDATVRKLKGYMPYTVSGSKIAYGGIIAFKIA